MYKTTLTLFLVFSFCFCQPFIGSKKGGSSVTISKTQSAIQSFIAKTTIIRKIDARIIASQATLELKDESGQVLGVASFSGEESEIIEFVFPNPVSVIVGKSYYARVTSKNQYFYWIGDLPGTYLEGSAWIDESELSADLWMDVFEEIHLKAHEERKTVNKRQTIETDVRVFDGNPSGGTLLNAAGQLAQSFVTGCTSIARLTIWAFVSNAPIVMTIREAINGNILYSGTATANGFQMPVLFIFPTAITVTPGQMYWIQGYSNASASWWAARDYPDGNSYRNSILDYTLDYMFQIEGYLAPNPYPNCTGETPTVSGTASCWGGQTEVNIYRPATYVYLCTTDFVLRDIYNFNNTFQFVVYESSQDDINSIYNRVSYISRSAAARNVILKYTSTFVSMRPDRYYAIGFTCTSYPCFNQFGCLGGFTSSFLSLSKTLGNDSLASFTPTMNFSSLIDVNGIRTALRFYFAPAPGLTTAPPISTGAITSASMTSAQVTSGPLTTSPLTTSPLTTARLTTSPLTTSPVTSQAMTSSPLTTSPITSGDITTSPLTTAELTTGEITSGEFTTGDITTSPLTTAELTTAEVTTAILITTAQIQVTSGNMIVQATSGEANNQKSSDGGNRSAVGPIVGGVLAVLLLVVIILAIAILRKRKRAKDSNGQDSVGRGESAFELKLNVSQQSSRPLPILTNIQIKKQLGSGSYGQVYLGDWNGTKVAMKKLKDKDQIEQFMKEAGTLSQVIHPNCVQFLGLYTSDSGEQYMVTEYLPKGALKDILQKKRGEFSAVDLLTMGFGAAKGLAYLENKKILHRDVALRNLLAAKIDGEFTAKVADFGFSRLVASGAYEVKAETMIPVKWTAPEVLKGAPATVKNDVWAFGVTLWEIFSYGQEPYAWMSNKEASFEIPKGERLPKPEDCPEGVYQIMQKCWASNPEERPTFIKIVNEIKSLRKSILNIPKTANTKTTQDLYNIAPMKNSVGGAYENKFQATATPTPYVQAKNNEYDDGSKSSTSNSD